MIELAEPQIIKVARRQVPVEERLLVIQPSHGLLQLRRPALARVVRRELQDELHALRIVLYFLPQDLLRLNRLLAKHVLDVKKIVNWTVVLLLRNQIFADALRIR